MLLKDLVIFSLLLVAGTSAYVSVNSLTATLGVGKYFLITVTIGLGLEPIDDGGHNAM